MIHAVRRLGRERIDRALVRLPGCRRSGSVHDVRKEIKKLRAILRLVREGISQKDYRRCKQALREAGRRLAVLRDARVQLAVFTKLRRRYQNEFRVCRFFEIKNELHKNHRRETDRFLKGDSVASVKHLLRKVGRRIKTIKIKTDGWAAIGPGLKASYNCGKTAGQAVRKEASPANLHEWRKRVKDLWYQIRLLAPIQPGKMSAHADRLKMLSEHLGDDHDLVLLKQFVAGGKFKKSAVLNGLIGRRRKELRSAAIKFDARLYAKRPAAFCNQFGRYWSIWRGGKRALE